MGPIINTGISRYGDIINIIYLHWIDSDFHLQNICYSRNTKNMFTFSGGQTTHMFSLNREFISCSQFMIFYYFNDWHFSQTFLEQNQRLFGTCLYFQIPQGTTISNKYSIFLSWKHKRMDLWFSILSILYVVDRK